MSHPYEDVPYVDVDVVDVDVDGIPLIHDGDGFIDEVEWLERGGHG